MDNINCCFLSRVFSKNYYTNISKGCQVLTDKSADLLCDQGRSGRFILVDVGPNSVALGLIEMLIGQRTVIRGSRQQPLLRLLERTDDVADVVPPSEEGGDDSIESKHLELLSFVEGCGLSIQNR